MEDHGHRGPIIATAGATIAVVGTFLPWLRSGARNRSSYTVVDLVERLGFAPDGVVGWSLQLWPLAPLATVATTLGAWMVAAGRLSRPVHATCALLVASWLGGTALAVAFAPGVALFRIGAGPWVTLVGAVLFAAGTAFSRRESAAGSRT